MLLCCNCIEHIGMFNILNNEGMGTLSYSKKICWDWFTLKTEKKNISRLIFKDFIWHEYQTGESHDFFSMNL